MLRGAWVDLACGFGPDVPPVALGGQPGSEDHSRTTRTIVGGGRCPADYLAGFFRLYRPDAPTSPPSAHLERALARVNDEGKPWRRRQIRFCPSDSWYDVAPDADLSGVEGVVA